jgi:Dyp-type peroxidase family
LDLNNIQGDILGGLPKKTETKFFFQIVNVTSFRKQLQDVIPLITTVAKVLKDRDAIDKHKKKPYPKPELIPLWGVNISFSHFGFVKLGINDTNLVDAAFLGGQEADAESLGDSGTGTGPTFVPDWIPQFKEKIDGLIIFSGDSHATVNAKVHQVLTIFGFGTPKSSVAEVFRVTGDVRPGNEAGHEHFGFKDGISNPAVIGFDTNPPPGPPPVLPGVILVGRVGDASQTTRDPWMVDGSFLTFRFLFQLVPEFNKFLTDNPLPVPGLSPKQGSELLGSRLVGRWKSGAPIDLRPFDDDVSLAANVQGNNDFSYAAELGTQKLCPFAAHTRKTNPRADLNNQVQTHRIMRRGIQFGPEVTPEEQKEQKTIEKRGLLFQCYQSSIENGFRFIQTKWANNPTFPFTQTTKQVPGFDAIIGQGVNRQLSGTNPDDPTIELGLPTNWVVPHGGEYFFAPSLAGLKGTIAS